MEWCGSTASCARPPMKRAGRLSTLFAPNATFRDFVNLYIAEGYRRNRNCVSLANSDAAVIAVAAMWMRRLSRNKLDCRLQYHADQDLDELRAYWGRVLNVEPELIGAKRKVEQRSARRPHLALEIRRLHRAHKRHVFARKTPGVDGLPERGVARLGSRRGVAKPGYRAAFGAPRSAVRIRPPRSRRFESADLTKP